MKLVKYKLTHKLICGAIWKIINYGGECVYYYFTSRHKLNVGNAACC